MTQSMNVTARLGPSLPQENTDAMKTSFHAAAESIAGMINLQDTCSWNDETWKSLSSHNA